MNKKIILLFLSIISLYSNDDYKFLISDYDFTNQISFLKFQSVIKSYENNRLTFDEIDYIYSIGKQYQINPLVLLMKIEQENGLLRNNNPKNYELRKFNACGYGLRIKSLTNIEGYKYGTNMLGEPGYYLYGGFKKQIRYCAKFLRKEFNKFDGKNTPVAILNFSKEWDKYVDNSATYALFRYCPYYGHAKEYKDVMVGNLHVKYIWNEIKEKQQSSGMFASQ